MLDAGRRWSVRIVGGMSVPELVEPQPIQPRAGLPRGRVVLAPDPTRPSAPAVFEWELRVEEWADEHPHDEYVYVLEGELHVTVDGTTVVARPGALVRVPAGSRGRYAAPVHARMLGIYGPRPAELQDALGMLRRL
jgi:uncharacterized cupin superfamily protein